MGNGMLLLCEWIELAQCVRMVAYMAKCSKSV